MIKTEQPDDLHTLIEGVVRKEVHRQEHGCLMQTAVVLNILSIFILLYINITFDTLKI
jgi:hypothetical protein